MTIHRILFTVAIVAHAGLLLAQTKVPVPSAEEQSKALALVREVYKEQYEEAKTPAAREALARELLERGAKTTDLNSRYALLRVARDLAIQVGSPTAFRAVDAMGESYQVDVLDMKTKVLGSYVSMPRSTSQNKAIAEMAMGLARQALGENRAVVARQLGKLGLAAAEKAKDNELKNEFMALDAKVEQVVKAEAEFKTALAKLDTSPTDPVANLAVGKNKCFLKGDWKNGLPMLALGNDAVLKDLAVKEMKGAKQPAEQMQLGDGWLAQAEKAQGLAKEHLLAYAYHWYSRAAAGVTGLHQVHVAKKMRQIRATGLLAVPVPNGAKEFRGHYYMVFTTRMTWHLAGETCKNLGGHLLRIESPEEQQFIQGFAGGGSSPIWIDGSDAVQEKDWRFGDGKGIGYTNWSRGQPDNHSGIEHSPGFNPDGKWNDRSAAGRLPFVCEWDAKLNPISSTPEPKGKIPRGTVVFARHRYLRFDDPTTRHVAMRTCEQMGGHLVRVESQREEAFVKQLIAKGKRGTYWLDGSDEVAEGEWTFSDGSKMVYLNWGRGEPNNADGREHSLAISKKNGQLFDGSCSRRHGFICEWDK